MILSIIFWCIGLIFLIINTRLNFENKLIPLFGVLGCISLIFGIVSCGSIFIYK